MILIEAILLIYAVNRDAIHHEASREWLQETLSGTIQVGLPWICMLGFLRVTTHPRIFPVSLQPNQALAYFESWLAQPFVDAVALGEGDWTVLHNLLRTTGSAGILATDAHVAALAIEHGATVCSTDHDFKRFPGVHHVSPLEPVVIHQAQV